MKNLILFLFIGLIFMPGCGVKTSIRKSKIADSKLSEKCIYLQTETKFLGLMTTTRLLSYTINFQQNENNFSLNKIIKQVDEYIHRNNLNFDDVNDCIKHPIVIKYASIFELLSKQEVCNIDNYATTKQIISINPTIVVTYPSKIYSIDKPIILFRSIYNHLNANVQNNGCWHQFGSNIVSDTNSIMPGILIDAFDLETATVLQSGYIVDNTIPQSSGDLFWFSPDMNIKPQPLEIDKDGLGHIPTPWGELVLTPKEDSWSVTAESK